MPRMIDLIRASAVPANLVQSAARGGLAIPQPEMLEILVHLATETKTFCEQASLTLAGWDEAFCRTAAANPIAPKSVLAYFSSPQNFRPALFDALLANPSVPEESLAALVASISRDQAENALHTERVKCSHALLSALATNPNLNGIQSATIDEQLATLAQSHSTVEAYGKAPSSSEPESIEQPAEPSQEERDADEEVAKYIAAHTTELTAEEKPFQPVGGIYEDIPTETEVPVAKTAAASAGQAETAVAVAPESKAPAYTPKRGSALQRISKLDVKGRIQLAMKGDKEERALLIRDGTKIVALAVLDSGKITDSEVEKFAGQKNVLEAVLRAIPMKRRYMKQYNIVRNLVCNPRTPIDVSLTLMKNILVSDLKNLSGNKEVSETVRKSALRMFKQKLTADK
ncbi:MAG: hypothetical protein ACRD2U_06515 [Terriglobales bacterium]